MRKGILIITTMIAAMIFSESQAQRVLKATDGKIHIDVQDLDERAWSKTSLNYAHDQGSPYNSLYKRFEVAKSDEGGTFGWDGAKSQCASKGAGWRLPTERELMLMWILKDGLIQAGSSSFASGNYWSSTENSSPSNRSWYVGFGSGATGTNLKSNPNIVRCIRET